jgi:N-acetylglucosaminyl-diphospho-decaprenol L-rhamnosyltransferase
MALFISVINHNHDTLISQNETLSELSREHFVIIKSNTPAKQCLIDYCNDNSIYLFESQKNGFGANNNEVFRIAKSIFGMNNDDLFLVLNPDIEITLTAINNLINELKNDKVDIAAINLFLDKSLTEYDNSIRYYPKIINPIKTLLKINRKDLYDKNKIQEPIKIEWAAGSFLLFTVKSYEKLNGFDESYFMYFEDADICTRANTTGLTIKYFPNIKAIHYAFHNNRKLLSKHFLWYLRSLLKYHTRFVRYKD